MIPTICNACSFAMEVPDKFAGQKIRCRKCGKPCDVIPYETQPVMPEQLQNEMVEQAIRLPEPTKVIILEPLRMPWVSIGFRIGVGLSLWAALVAVVLWLLTRAIEVLAVAMKLH